MFGPYRTPPSASAPPAVSPRVHERRGIAVALLAIGAARELVALVAGDFSGAEPALAAVVLIAGVCAMFRR
jgi:hypothetical protein